MEKDIKINSAEDNGFKDTKHHEKHTVEQEKSQGPHGHTDTHGKQQQKGHAVNHVWPVAHEDKRGHKI